MRSHRSLFVLAQQFEACENVSLTVEQRHMYGVFIQLGESRHHGLRKRGCTLHALKHTDTYTQLHTPANMYIHTHTHTHIYIYI